MKKPCSSVSRREFVHALSAGIAATELFSWDTLGNSSKTKGVSEKRLERLARGTNVCGWFRGRGPKPEELKHYVTESEAERIRAMGLTHVRLCLQPRVVMDFSTGEVRQEIAALVEAAIERFHRADLLVLVDLHNEDRAAEIDPAWQKAFLKFWSDFAGRLKHFDPDLTMFEIINEPVFKGKEEEWSSLNQQLADAIRKEAPEHTIMTSGPNWGGIDGLRRLKLLEDPNVVYSFHCYDPFPFTHQGATWAGPDVRPLRGVPYPSSPEAVLPLLQELEAYPASKKLVENYGNQSWNKARLAARFKQGIEWGAQNHVPLYCGEFGVYPPYAKTEHRANWFRDFGEVLQENQIGWAVWGWDEGFGLNRRYVNDKLEVDQTVAKALGLKVA